MFNNPEADDFAQECQANLLIWGTGTLIPFAVLAACKKDLSAYVDILGKLGDEVVNPAVGIQVLAQIGLLALAATVNATRRRLPAKRAHLGRRTFFDRITSETSGLVMNVASVVACMAFILAITHVVLTLKGVSLAVAYAGGGAVVAAILYFVAYKLGKPSISMLPTREEIREGGASSQDANHE